MAKKLYRTKSFQFESGIAGGCNPKIDRKNLVRRLLRLLESAEYKFQFVTKQNNAYLLLKEIGEWMDINGEAIYATRAIAPFKEGKVCYTQKKNSDTVYAIYMSNETETTIPEQIHVDSFIPTKDGIITLLGCKEKLSWEKNGRGILINIPERIRKNPPLKYIWSFKIDKLRK